MKPYSRPENIPQVLTLKDGEKIKGRIISMLDREFLVREAGKFTSRKVKIDEVEFVASEGRN